MSATLYLNELTSLISESKRKHSEVKTLAERSLQELRSITITSEQQLAADIRRRPDFIDAFLKACQTSNPKLAISAVNALQRMVISQGLPIARLDETLQAFNSCAELGLDLQLKVLQALPSLVQNYSEELRGDLLGSALQVCASLQGAKVSTISAVAAATLQQLVAAVFARVTEEDQHDADIATIASVHGDGGSTVDLRPAAYDAYRVFRDIVLAADGRSTQFVQVATLAKEECLELIASCFEAQPQLIHEHSELSNVVRTSVVTLATTCLTDNVSFSITIRGFRILRLLILWYFDLFKAELEPAISLFAHTLEDTSLSWKRILTMELLRDMFLEQGLIIKAYNAFDQAGTKSVVQDILAAFVRLSSEKPAIIGLGQQSTCPIGPEKDTTTEQLVTDPVGGMAGMLSSLGITETNVQGISSQWSIPKTPCYDQLDKIQPPTLPETYIYTLVLECLNGFSDTLAKTVLPLTVRQKDSETTLVSQDVKAAVGLVESCWPAVLATCSTFMNAALDDAYYRNLIKAYQRFAQVAGLLQLDTPRDALMTTLGKAAVPPQVLNAAQADTSRSPIAESPRVFSNSRNLLSIESLVSQASSLSSEKDRRLSMEHTKPVLTVRNLLCLRALLNLAIALGPTLQNAFGVIVQALRQADIVLSVSGVQQMKSNPQSDSPLTVQTFSAEVAAVEAAASRLLESTADYSDEAFLVVLRSFTSLLHVKLTSTIPTIQEESGSPVVPISKQRTFSGLSGISNTTELLTKNFQFVLPKLGNLAALNVSRFLSNDIEANGWSHLSDEVLDVVISNSNSINARKAATNLLCRLVAECINESSQLEDEDRKAIQTRSFALLLRIVIGIYSGDDRPTNSDLEVQDQVFAALKVILEQSGDAIAAGWNHIIAILSSTFECKQGTAITVVEDLHILWSELTNEFVSSRLGRDAFSATQLLVTEFFSLLPIEASAGLVQLLYRFMSQTEDLNLSLTAITIAWNVADILSKHREKDAKLPEITNTSQAKQFESDLTALSHISSTGQWLLLLVKMRQIVQHGQREPAKAAFQTLCSIAKNIESSVSTQIWAIVLRHVVLGVLADDAESSDWEARALTPILLQGASETIAQQIELINELPKLIDTWDELLVISQRYLQRAHLPTVTATYQALSTMLASVETLTGAWDQATTKSLHLWSTYQPQILSSTMDSNQPALRAYCSLASELLRLRKAVLEAESATVMITSLSECIKLSGSTTYSADCFSLTALQSEVLAILRSMPPALDGVLSQQIETAATFASLHLHAIQPSTDFVRPSFIALGAESLTWLQELILRRRDNAVVIHNSSLESAVTSLADIIEAKYKIRTQYKGVWLWRRATETAIALAHPIMTRLDHLDTGNSLIVSKQYLRIARNIVHANGLAEYKDIGRIRQDEQEDVQASQMLMKVISQYLAGEELQDEILAYVHALFQASIIHESEEMAEETPLSSLATLRQGRIRKVIPSTREDICYECLSQLVKLSSDEAVHIAKLAAPLLTRRLAIPIKSYIADQPLRRRMPQPLSELEELLYCFKVIEELKLHPEALHPGGERAHLRYLYPLLTKAIRVAGDKWCGSQEVLDPLQRLLEGLMLW